MDELYLDNIDEYVNDHNKIVSQHLCSDQRTRIMMTVVFTDTLQHILGC